jgi:hypothetical protein
MREGVAQVEPDAAIVGVPDDGRLIAVTEEP